MTTKWACGPAEKGNEVGEKVVKTHIGINDLSLSGPKSQKPENRKF